MSRVGAGFGFIVVLGLAFGCATPQSPELDRARATYDAAIDGGLDPAASVDLYEAKKQLDTASQALEDGEDLEVVGHLSYLAEKRVEIAKLRYDTKQTRAAAEQMASERDGIRLDARAREAATAQAQAATQAERAAAAEAAAVVAAERASQQAQRADAEAQRAADAEARAHMAEEKLAELDAVQTERGLLLTLGAVLFEFDSADLKPEAYDRIERLAAYLNSVKDRGLLIEGFTDDVGGDEYNLDLSKRRADAVRSALVERGVDRTRILADGFGKQYPLVPNDSATNRDRNRRVEILILRPGESPGSARRSG